MLGDERIDTDALRMMAGIKYESDEFESPCSSDENSTNTITPTLQALRERWLKKKQNRDSKRKNDLFIKSTKI